MSDIRIPLSDGTFAVVDELDLPRVQWLRWRVTRTGHVMTTIRYRRVFLHRMLLDAPDDKVVDHKDGDPRNNRRANLRVCSREENLLNRKKHKNNTSGFTGVKALKSGRFSARITYMKRRHELGTFQSAEEAYAAYKTAAERLHGGFARHLNEPTADGVDELLRALPRPKSRRGFAAMPRDQVARIASLGGKAVPSDRRGFSVDRELAARAGRSSRLNG